MMSWDTTISKGRKLRRGYTTGSCAAAAAKAAAYMLFSGEQLEQISISTPAGITLELSLENIRREGERVSCSVTKFSGDDPDVTNGLQVFASVEKMQNEVGVVVRAGEGVGTVTRPGLQVEVGRPAINPVPMAMITNEVGCVLPPNTGVIVTISIPGGEKAAERTFNARLGVEGGLSILGTTGIVEPMSEDVFKEILSLELQQLLPGCADFLVLVPGNLGKSVALHQLFLPSDRVLKMSNFVGFILDECRHRGVKRLLLVGHIGKLFKVAAGIFHTHSRVADARFEIFAAQAALLGADQQTIHKLQRCSSVEEMLTVLEVLAPPNLYDIFSEKVSLRARDYAAEELEIGTVLFSLKKGILGMDDRARKLVEEYTWKRS